MNCLTVFEFDKLVLEKAGGNTHDVPELVFSWLKTQCLEKEEGQTAWAKICQVENQVAVQVLNYVGVVRTPCGFQIEILPKIGKKCARDEARGLLIEMLKCLFGFRHIQTSNAALNVVRMPLLEVFIQQFLNAVGKLVKRGLRSDYDSECDNLFALRGKLLVSKQISQNLFRRNRFYTEHDEFSQNRPENRLIHSALRVVLAMCRSQENQRLGRELCFVFSDVPQSIDIDQDIQRIRLDRGMSYYETSLDWAKLILNGMSPIVGDRKHHAPSLLFPMEALFEAYVQKHLAKQLQHGYDLKPQSKSKSLVLHMTEYWFRLKPDLLIEKNKKTRLLLDAKWKLLDSKKNNGTDNYQLSQSDFYQLYAYGHHYLDGCGDMVLIYPKTDAFEAPLSVFSFPQHNELRLWVLPFCLTTRRLILPKELQFLELFLSEKTRKIDSFETVLN
jgi:5-methylcytosine-specific restriction enzyme subunit McrC